MNVFTEILIREIVKIVKSADVQQINTPYGKKNLDLSYEIPYLAGYSKDGNTIYVDKRVNLIFKLKDGREMNVLKYLVVHESTEKHLEDEKDYKYQYAHEKATGKEREIVEADGYPWEEYQKYVLSEVKRLNELDKSEKLPDDLDEKPETDTKDYLLLKEIHKRKTK